RFADVTLRGGPVAEVGDDRAVAVRVTGADVAVALDAHAISGGVQRMRADHERRHVVVVLARVPAAVLAAAVEHQQPAHVQAADPRHTVLPVGGEHEVLAPQRPGGADLCRLLPEAGRPETELTLPLQGGGLGVKSAGQRHVAVEVLERRAVQVVRAGRVDRVLRPIAGGREQLDGVARRAGPRVVRSDGAVGGLPTCVGGDHFRSPSRVLRVTGCHTYASVGYGSVGSMLLCLTTPRRQFCRDPPTTWMSPASLPELGAHRAVSSRAMSLASVSPMLTRTPSPTKGRTVTPASSASAANEPAASPNGSQTKLPCGSPTSQPCARSVPTTRSRSTTIASTRSRTTGSCPSAASAAACA